MGRAARFLAKIPKGGGAALAITFELLFPPPAGDNYYDRNPKNPPPKYKLHPPDAPKEVEPPDYPFYGGQMPGVLYNVTYEYGGSNIPKYVDTQRYYGPVLGVRFQQFNGGNTIYYITSGGFHAGGYRPPSIENQVTNFFGMQNPFIRITGIKRVDLAPDTGGNPSPRNNPTVSAPGNSLGAPSAAPPSTAPSPAPPSTRPNPKPNLPGEAPKPKRHPGPVPAPTPAPGDAPQPNKYPERVPNPDPYPTPNGDPAPSPGPGVGAPSPSPTPAPAPGPSPYRSPPLPDPTDYPDTGFQPKIFQPNPLIPGPGLAPNPLEPRKFAPNPNTGNPEPKAPPLTSPNKSPDPEKTTEENIGDQVKKLIGPLGIAIAAIDALVQPSKIREAARAATCEAFAPGGCNAPIANNAASAAANSASNNALLNSIMAFLQALLIPIKGGVDLINTKLGPVMAGVNGIGGFLGRLNTSLGVDRVINLVTTAGVIHNCMMLSSSISDTLFSTLDNVFAIPSLIKNPDGETVDTRETFTKYLDGMFAGIFGTTEWIAIKNQWKAYSTIYNTGSQVFGNIRDIFDETSQIQEVTRNWVAELGNGLQDEGVIGEDNWNVKDPTKQIKGKYFARLQRIAEGLEQVENVAEDLEQITSSARNIVETANEIKENTTAISTAVSEANKAAKLDRDAKEEGLELPNFSLEDLF